MAPRMNAVLTEARKRGLLVIHCPSSCLDFYQGTPMVELAQQAPKIDTAVPLQGWCHIDPQREPPLPIDDSDGGCDCTPQCAQGNPWTRQIATLEIQEDDAITDSAEAYYLMKQRGIDNVIVMGVHTNMCVLGRPFGLRQLSKNGKRVVLMRDMTDSMYNPNMWPFVSHFTGTDLIIGHIELLGEFAIFQIVPHQVFIGQGFVGLITAICSEVSISPFFKCSSVTLRQTATSQFSKAKPRTAIP